ncbi:hypothetical protein BC827DRAFT_1268414 [Russula dissimulans]|nr:hypothetical protein BC827DRAFT_1268414 [Russula dissimulans]
MSEVQTQRPSSEEFDALIELLATVDDSDNSNFHIAPEGSASTGLRDASGKLDFAKIRLSFSQRRAKSDDSYVPSSEPLHNEPQPEMKLPQIVVEEPTASSEGTHLPDPLPQRRDTESSEIKEVPKDSGVDHPQSVPLADASSDSIVLHLEDALSGAQEEVSQLRRQVLELQSQVATLFKSNLPQVRHEGDTHEYLANSEKLAISTPSDVQDAFATGTTVPIVPTNADLSDVERAMQFLIRTDELVWRRSRYPNGPRAPVFSQRNVDALTERLTLWENIVRAPAPS